MRCLDAAQIARAATIPGEIDVHLEDCLACRRRLEADRATRVAVAGLPIPALSSTRRRELAAEIMAMADRRPRTRRRRRLVSGATAAALAIAAAVALVAWRPRATETSSASPPVIPVLAAVEEPTLSARSVVHLDPPPTLLAPQIDASGGTRLVRSRAPDRDVLTLVDGQVEVDTRSARKVDVQVGDSVVHVDDARVRIRARHRGIVSVQVVFGAARITGPDQRVTLQVDSVWFPGPSATQLSLAAFRDGWIALRSGRNREALELFDRVTDPIVLEEATYWAAVAARRSGDTTLANQRIAGFRQRFPRSQFLGEIDATP